jgi:hypothetical protein
MDYKVDHGHFYIVYKNQDPEKALLIDKFHMKGDMKFMDYTVDYGNFYIVYKNQDPEKAILIDDFIQIDDIKLLEQFTDDMINCKFDYYKRDGTLFIEDCTLLNDACTEGSIKKINRLIEKGADLMHKYEYRGGKRNCLIDLQNCLSDLEFHEDKEDQKYKKEAIELLIKKFEQYEEDIKKPNKFCRNI